MRKWRKCNGRKTSNRPCHYFGEFLIDGKHYCSFHKQQANRVAKVSDRELNSLLLLVTTAKPGQHVDYKKLWLTVVPRLLNEINRLKGKAHE